jgi:hypothetical protein
VTQLGTELRRPTLVSLLARATAVAVVCAAADGWLRAAGGWCLMPAVPAWAWSSRLVAAGGGRHPHSDLMKESREGGTRADVHLKGPGEDRQQTGGRGDRGERGRTKSSKS